LVGEKTFILLFPVGCLVALYQQITYVTVDDEKR
jgi:hypothetical protein